ncbi:hypothetical protein [Streptomyces natalensis]|uniref:hypothetical protein n=1 Tax=Streptomyces natalensis TaxID=68242 RepID=UPI0012FF49A5|nr:hypothetical protein [Streptomyces natalensis]
MEDVEYVEDVSGVAYDAEQLGDVHGVAWPRVREQLAELRLLKRVEATGGAASSSNVTGSSIPASARTKF